MESFENTLLIVDDNKDNLKVLQELLKPEGYSIRIATHGQGALESIQAKHPDLILLDIQLPDITGYEVCQQLKTNDETRDIPVIFLSALDDPQDKVKGFSAGGVDYVTKPFHSAELLARVRTHLTIGRLQYELQQINDSLEQRILKRTQELEQICDRLSGEIERRKEQERQYLWSGKDRRQSSTPQKVRGSDYVNQVYHLLRELLHTEITNEQRNKIEKIKSIIVKAVEEELIELPDFNL